MENFVTNLSPWEMEERRKEVKKVLEQYRDFVIDNAHSNLYGQEVKDERLEKAIDKIFEILSNP